MYAIKRKSKALGYVGRGWGWGRERASDRASEERERQDKIS